MADVVASPPSTPRGVAAPGRDGGRGARRARPTCSWRRSSSSSRCSCWRRRSSALWISLHHWNPLRATSRSSAWRTTSTSSRPARSPPATSGTACAATGIFTVASVPFLVAVPLLIAVLLNQKIKGGNVFRAVFFAPYVLGVAVIGVIWKYLLDPQSASSTTCSACSGYRPTSPGRSTRRGCGSRSSASPSGGPWASTPSSSWPASRASTPSSTKRRRVDGAGRCASSPA